ncbi:hypothetical protein SUNI508_05318 [Seiridium unicorne]|uniref:Uncharacterized protein n=1 Tax=Seiridium unicorne TaxID=138068 RepID=A0ABR2V474_9PEZI
MSGIAALINLTAPNDGDTTWTVEQKEVTIDTTIADSEGPTQDISWRFGPFSMEGHLDLNTFEMSSAKGSTALYLKNGNEVWIHLDIEIVWNGTYKGDYEIFRF